MIVEALYRIKVRLRDWVADQAHRESAERWLFLISFLESSVFPIPPDVMLVPLVISQKKRAYRFAFIVTIGSVLGGLLGYAIGSFFYGTIGAWLVDTYHLMEEIQIVEGYFNRNAFIAIFISAFTPIPYKAFTITGGAFGVSLPIFIIASLIGRGARFYFEAFIMRRHGEQIGRIFFKYFNLITLALALLFLVWIFLR